MFNPESDPDSRIPPPSSNLQALRAVYKNDLSTPIPQADSEVVYLDYLTMKVTGEKIILWENILLAFEDALHVRHGSRVLPFLRGPDLKIIIPIRIAALPDVILDVVIREPLVPVAPNSLSTPTSAEAANRSYNSFRNLLRRLDADDGHIIPEHQLDLDGDYSDLCDNNVLEVDDLVVLPVPTTTATRASTSTRIHSSRLLGSNVVTRSHATTNTLTNRTTPNITTNNNNNTGTSIGAPAAPDRTNLRIQSPAPPASTTTAYNINPTTAMNPRRLPSTSDNAYLATFADDYDYDYDDDYDDDDEDWEVSMTDWVNNIGDLNAISSSSNPPPRPGPSTRTQPADQPRPVVGTVSTTDSTTMTTTTPHTSAATLLFAQQYPQQQVRPSVPAILDIRRRDSTPGWNNNNTTTMINNFNFINSYGTPFALGAATVTATTMPTTVPSAQPVQPRPATVTTATTTNTTNATTPTSLAAALVAALEAQSSQQPQPTSGVYLQGRRNRPPVVADNIYAYTANTPQSRRTTTTSASTTRSQTLPTRPAQRSQQQRQVRRPTIDGTSESWSNAFPSNTNSTSPRHCNWRYNHHDCAGLSTTRARGTSIRPHGAHLEINTTLPNSDAINTNTSPNWTLWRNGRRYPTPATIPEAQRIFYNPPNVINDSHRAPLSSSSPSLTTRTTAISVINAIASPSASSSTPTTPTANVGAANDSPCAATATATAACTKTTTATEVAITTTATTAITIPPSSSLSHFSAAANPLSTDTRSHPQNPAILNANDR